MSLSFFFFKQKTAYDMRISDWSSDVCSSDLIDHIHDWVLGSNGKWVTMSVPSDGSYGIPEGVMYGVPVTTKDGEYTRVEGLEIDDFSRAAMDKKIGRASCRERVCQYV